MSVYLVERDLKAQWTSFPCPPCDQTQQSQLPTGPLLPVNLCLFTTHPSITTTYLTPIPHLHPTNPPPKLPSNLLLLGRTLPPPLIFVRTPPFLSNPPSPSSPTQTHTPPHSPPPPPTPPLLPLTFPSPLPSSPPPPPPSLPSPISPFPHIPTSSPRPPPPPLSPPPSPGILSLSHFPLSPLLLLYPPSPAFSFACLRPPPFRPLSYTSPSPFKPHPSPSSPFS